MRRKTPQYIKYTNYLSTQEKVHKDKIHIIFSCIFLFLYVEKLYCVFFLCGLFFL